MTLREARQLRPGETLHHVTATNADGTPQRWIVNGAVKLWKTDPTRIRVPVKHGLYSYESLTASTLVYLERPNVST